MRLEDNLFCRWLKIGVVYIATIRQAGFAVTSLNISAMGESLM